MDYSEVAAEELKLMVMEGNQANNELRLRQKAAHEETLRSYVGKYFAKYGFSYKAYRRFDSVGVLDGDFCAMGVEVSVNDADEIGIEFISFDEPMYSSQWVEISVEDGEVFFRDIAGKAMRILTGVGV